MIIWIDAQLSPDLAQWVTENFKVEAKSLRDLGLRDAQDMEIFIAARKASAVVMSKDADFISLLEQHGHIYFGIYRGSRGPNSLVPD